MALLRNPLDVSINLDRIVCIDEGDGPGDAEPYLWTLFYKIDGATVRFGENDKLQGTVTLVRTNGHQGNLNNTDVDAGDVVAIPPSVGAWNTVLTPIPIADSKLQLIKDLTRAARGTEWTTIPGVVGVVCILMEEDNLPDSSAVAGYNAFCSTFETRMNELINTLGLLKLGLTEEDERGLSDAVRQAIEDAMAGNLNFLESVWNWVAGPDQVLGNAAWRFSHDDLVNRSQIFFHERWKEGVSVFDPFNDPLVDFVVRGPGRAIESGGEWQIFGSISATPVPQFIGSFGPVVTFTESEMAMKAFRHRAEVATQEGFVGAFPNFYTATYGRNHVGGTVFLKPGAAEWRDVPLSELGDPPLDSFAARFRATNHYATEHGFVGGFPNFFHAEKFVFSPYVSGLPDEILRAAVVEGHASTSRFEQFLTPIRRYGPRDGITGLRYATVCGTVLVRPEHAEWRDVPLAELGNPPLSDIGARFRATSAYAVQHGFVGGFPTFFHADYGHGIVCGTILLKATGAEWRDVLLWRGPA
jgi:hypothetical protein